MLYTQIHSTYAFRYFTRLLFDWTYSDVRLDQSGKIFQPCVDWCRKFAISNRNVDHSEAEFVLKLQPCHYSTVFMCADRHLETQNLYVWMSTPSIQ